MEETLNRAIVNSLEAFRPPEHITVSEWADKYRMLSSEETSRPGMWNTADFPYTRFIMDCFNDKTINEIVMLKCTQIGGTEMLLNMVGYTIDQNPSRVYYVLPDDDLCEKFSEGRLKKMFTSCSDRFEDKVHKKNTSKFIKYDGGFIALASARSPSELASWSVPIVLCDEIDKFPMWSGREANPLKLAEERTKNWPVKKVVKVSTPTLKTGAIYKAYEATDVKYEFVVPCPHCGKHFTYKMSQLKWPKDAAGNVDITMVRYQAYYECEYCKGRIDNRHKATMLRNGQWRAKNKTVGKPGSVGFHINSIYSPWLSFGDVVEEFLSSKDDPELLMNFINSWLGEPWEDKAATLDSDIILEKQTDVSEGVVPEWAQLLTAGIDCQKNGYYWVIRAWGYKLTSQLVARGWAESLEEIENIMNRYWMDEDGELRWQVNLAAIDSGYDTETIYEFCLFNGSWAVPVKGSSTKKVARFTRSNIDAIGKNYHAQPLYIVNGDSYKDLIASRVRRPLGQGCWMVFNGCDREYAEQVTAEHKIVTNKNGRNIESWVPKTAHADNHYLDCEVYAALAADLLQVRYLQEESPQAASEPGMVARKQENDDWFKTKKGGWL